MRMYAYICVLFCAYIYARVQNYSILANTIEAFFKIYMYADLFRLITKANSVILQCNNLCFSKL